MHADQDTFNLLAQCNNRGAIPGTMSDHKQSLYRGKHLTRKKYLIHNKDLFSALFYKLTDSNILACRNDYPWSAKLFI